MFKIQLASKNWIFRCNKFNMLGTLVFLIGTGIYVVVFPHLGEVTWIVASMSGGILQFFLISYLNKTKKGKIFDSSSEMKSQ